MFLIRDCDLLANHVPITIAPVHPVDERNPCRMLAGESLQLRVPLLFQITWPSLHGSIEVVEPLLPLGCLG